MSLNETRLFGHPARNPHKYGKMRRREQRLQNQLSEGCNGHTEAVEQMLSATRDRICQLSGLIPHCIQLRNLVVKPERRRMEPHVWTVTDGNDQIVACSYKGKRIERPVFPFESNEEWMDDEVVEALAIHAVKLLRTMLENVQCQLIEQTYHADDYIRRADDLWEYKDEERPFVASIVNDEARIRYGTEPGSN